jgi:hypothetical protein
MIYQTFKVQRNGLAANSRPRIRIVGEWLPEMGFVSGALAQVLPETDELVFNLSNENINYSELYHSTKELGGSLVRLHVEKQSAAGCPALITTGNHIYRAGLHLGDACIAKCEHGRISVRKVVGNVRLVNVARDKNERTGEPMPKVWICGDWLNSIGFTLGTLVTAAAEPNRITFAAHDMAVVYSDIVRIARRNKLRLLQVSEKGGLPLINFKGEHVDRAGFALGDILAADYEHGMIKLQKLDPRRFGF